MENFSFENQGTNTYLVYTFGETDVIDTMSLGMITNNRILGLAETIYQQLDDVRQVKYNVTAKVALSQFFTGAVNKKRLLGVFSGIVNSLLETEDYMLEQSSILLDLDYIFVNVTSCEPALICLPVLNNVDKATDIGMFFKKIVFQTQFDQTENCDYVAQILNFLNGGSAFSLIEFKKIIDGLLHGEQKVSRSDNQNPMPKEQKRNDNIKLTAPQNPTVTVPNQTIQNPIPQPNVYMQPQVNRNFSQPPQPYSAMKAEKKFSDAGKTMEGMEIPNAGGNAKQVVPNPVDTSGAGAEDVKQQMSAFYLLQHYNKENAAIYKAQKEAQKAEKKKASASKPTPMESFTVPGAPQQPNPAVPPQFSQPARQPAQGQNQFMQQGMNTPFNIPQQTPVQPQMQQSMAISPQPVRQPVQQVQPQASANFGDTTVLSSVEYGQTSVLGAAEAKQLQQPYLVRTRNNEKIPLDKPVFRIGKERSYVDYFIGDNAAISRSHANILNRDGKYFVVDTNSTNHTYVDGTMILSNQEVPLSHGTKIKLANEEFEFRMM